MSDVAFMVRQRSLAAGKLIGLMLLAALVIVWLGPIILVVMASIKSNDAFLAGPFALPTEPTFAPYVTVWNALGFGPLLANSFLYATAGSALAVILALVPSFALSRFDVPGKKLVFGVILTGLMLPQQTVLIPLYDTLRALNLLDTRIGLIIIHAAYGMPAQILILRGFMTTIPREIEKAAFLEGATDFQVLWKVILPLSVPGIMVGFTLNFIAILEGIRLRAGAAQFRGELPGDSRHAEAEQRPLHGRVQPAGRGSRDLADPDRHSLPALLPQTLVGQFRWRSQGLTRVSLIARKRHDPWPK
jgi:ABC-type glycerol-3-phosphate transport system permease component